jgi:hypothetical protein
MDKMKDSEKMKQKLTNLQRERGSLIKKTII